VSAPLSNDTKITVDDLNVRLLGIPFFGIVIPHLTGLFGPLGPDAWRYWGGYVWFVLLSGLVWQGNRFVLLAHRRRYDWSQHPWRKLLLIVGTNLFCAAPLCVVMLAGWYRFAGLAVDRQAVTAATLAVVVVALVVTHLYETVYLIRQRESGLLAVARLERARAEAELLALKSQVDPHFLFNCLNSLAYLIPREPQRAVAFTERLSDVYTYILLNRERDLVPLAEELAFAFRYVDLLRIRFGDAVSIQAEEGLDREGRLIPPVSLQVLLENAVKHNRVDDANPLEVRMWREGDALRVSNLVRRPPSGRPSAKVGLRNLDERCRRITGRGLEARHDAGRFTVVLPLVAG
jgi:hypothetical protein